MMQGRQWDLAHDEEDHLGALICGQRAGKGACRKETRLAQVGLRAARSPLRRSTGQTTAQSAGCVPRETTKTRREKPALVIPQAVVSASGKERGASWCEARAALK